MFYYTLCRDRPIVSIAKGGYRYCYCLTAEKDTLIFTNNVPANRNEVALLQILSARIKARGIVQIRFVETIKTDR